MVTGVSQKRIVGLGALTLVALVFLPGLFTNEKKTKVPEQAAIPLKVAPAPVKAPVLPEVYTDRSLAHLDVNFGDESKEPTVAALPEPTVELLAPATHTEEQGSSSKTAADIAEAIAPKSTAAASSNAVTTTAPTAVASAPKAEPQPVVKSAPKPAPKPEAPVLSPSTTPVTSVAAVTTSTASSARWVIRLGSFNNAANVNALVARLKLGGYSVYTLPTVPVDGSLTRVMVGPDSNRAKLEQAQQALTRDFQLTGQIISYDPNAQ